jgi:hypothetical protein
VRIALFQGLGFLPDFVNSPVSPLIPSLLSFACAFWLLVFFSFSVKFLFSKDDASRLPGAPLSEAIAPSVWSALFLASLGLSETGFLTLPDSMRSEVYGPYVGFVRRADVTVGRRRMVERDWRAIVILQVGVIIGCREID